MINKIGQTMAEAMAGIRDGAVILIGGFGSIGQPNALIEGLIEQGAKDLTVVAHNAGVGHNGLARVMEVGRVRKIVCSYPRTTDPVGFEELYRAGRIELEVMPQGTMGERMRAAGAGITAFYTPPPGNINPVMATAAKLTNAPTQHIIDLGGLDPEKIATPGIYVDRVVHVPY